jgi:hypothetical protein
MAKLDYKKHNEGSGEYKGVSSVPTPNASGYPNNIKSTQTVKVRGTGAQTKATKCTTKLG